MQKDQRKETVKEPKEVTKEIKETTPKTIDDKGLKYKDRTDHQTGQVKVRQDDVTRDSTKSVKAADQSQGRSGR